jgi:O-antigen/teichoic acid export membrane protein
VKLSEASYFIPLLVSNALFPAILSAKSKSRELYSNRLQSLSDFYFMISVALSIFVTLTAHYIITWLYGAEYQASIIILQIHIWAGVFIFLRSILSKWLIAEELFKFSLISQLSGALVNVVLNLLLIPLLGGIGAAISTFVSYLVSAILILAFFKATREIFWIFVRSIGLPFNFFRR